MAVTSIVLRIRDKKGKRSTSTINVSSAELLPDVIEFASALAQNRANMTLGVVESATINIGVDVSGLAGNTMADGADVEEGLATQFRTTNDFPTGTRLAAIDEVKLLPGGSKEVIIGDDVDFDQFANWMMAGFTATSTNIVSPVDKRGEDITSFEYALEDFQKTRK